MLSIVVLVASILACLIVGSLVISRGFRDRKVIVYGLLTFFLLLMSTSNFLSLSVTNDQLFYVRSVMASSTIVVYLGYRLVYTLRARRNYKIFYKTALFYLTLIVAVLDCTIFLFPSVVPGVPPRPIIGPGVILFFAHFIVAIILSIKQLAVDIKATSNKHERRQYTLLILGFLPAIILAPLTSFVLPSVGIDQTIVITPLYAVIFVVFVGYAIIRHGLFDIRQAVIRTFTYILSLATLSGIYYIIAYLLSILIFRGRTSYDLSISPINIVLALLLAFVFQPVKRFFDKITNRFFFRDNYNSDDFFARLNKILAITTDMQRLLDSAADEISRTLKSEQAFFFINATNGYHVSSGTPHQRQLSKSDVTQLEEYWQQISQGVMVASLMDPGNSPRRLLASRQLEIILPLVWSDKIIGFLCLGDHKTSGYTNRDIKALTAIAGSLAIAIQNALVVQEIRDLNINLQQRIDNATKELRSSNNRLRQLDKSKDEFVSMASHQLRTPLTSVKGYISMILDGNAGKITKAQRQLLGEAFVGTERMVRLISDFLNVSRLQTGKFTIDKQPVSLPKLIAQELDSLQSSATAYGLEFVYKQLSDIPLLNIDKDKMRQVIMNFTDNAIFYSLSGTSINVSLNVKDGHVIFKVKDTGIGVPRNEQKRLFSEFYRASNARKHRPDGTGVGLFLAKKTIDAHGGEIIFKSVENRGSTFGFKLPIKKLSVIDGTNDFDNNPDNQ
jgi:signal transduction histidine kinase